VNDTMKVLRRVPALLLLIGMAACHDFSMPFSEDRACGDNHGEPYSATPFDAAEYHPCKRECRAGSDAVYDCHCSRTCPCWDYH